MASVSHGEKDVFKHTIPHFMRLALEQILRETKRILQLNHFVSNSSDYVPIVQELQELALDVQLWLTGKNSITDPITYFKGRFTAIEAEADRVSRKLWKANRLNLSSVLDYADQEKARIDGKFTFMLRTHLDIQRMRLMEQVRGARLLRNNSDLGEEVERIFVEYLSANLDPDLMVLRGGHIFDLDGNSSKQMDIVVVPARTLSLTPADTTDGKCNVLVDQVVAAISVKSTLNPTSFEAAWADIQSIPPYAQKDEDFPALKGAKHAWPLCFILGANSSPLRELDVKWDELIQNGQSHQLQLFMSLERGYKIAGNSSWPLIAFFREDCKGSFNGGEELQAGLGLGWLLNGISARGAVIANRSISSFKRMRDVLMEAGMLTGCGSPSYSRRYDGPMLRMGGEIGGVVQWGRYGNWLHNSLFCCSLTVADKRVVDVNRPLTAEAERRYFDDVPYEPRWFEAGFCEMRDGNCHLREWVADDAATGYVSKDVLFDFASGKELDTPALQLSED